MSEITPIDVNGLEIVTNPADVRRDVHALVRDVQEREIRRRYRDNGLGKSDALRLAKLMSDPDAVQEIQEGGDSRWLDFVDSAALRLGFVSYDTEGSYRGYSSSERSYPDNYISFKKGKYRAFLKLSPALQESRILDSLIGDPDGTASELYRRSTLGRLEPFSTWGCATGVVPTLDFAKIRRFVLNVLKACEPGTWYSTASLVQHLEAEHPFFLIPKSPKDKCGKSTKRYGTFHESKQQWGNEINISDRAPDSFERVEGRYIERFLEGLPLALGYVDVAYRERRGPAIYPDIDLLQAFRVSSRLAAALSETISPPKVIVQPNFEVCVESDFYPASVLRQLTPLGDVLTEGKATVLRLKKEMVAARQAKDEGFDALSLLKDLTDRPLPQNVEHELRSWAAHSEKFTLYRGFGLLEGDRDLPAADPFTVESIAPTIRIIRSPEKLFDQLEQAELVPLRARHSDATLHALPKTARTVFGKQSAPGKGKAKQKKRITIKRQTAITLHLPTDALLKRLHKALLDARCPIEANAKNRTVTFSKKHEAVVDGVVKALRKDYVVRVEDIDA